MAFEDRNLTEGARIEDPMGQIEIGMVEQVEEIHTELETMAFASDFDFL